MHDILATCPDVVEEHRQQAATIIMDERLTLGIDIATTVLVELGAGLYDQLVELDR